MRTKQNGFTLVEVLISLGIFVLAAVVLGGAYLNVLSGYEHVGKALNRNNDLSFARADLLTQSDPDEVLKGGEFDSDDRHVTWTATFDPTETTNVFDVHFECVVTSPDRHAPEIITQNFRLLRPTWGKPADQATLKAKNADRINQLINGQ